MYKLLFPLILVLTSIQAHFLTLIPSTDNLQKQSTINFDISFIHPFEQTGMNMEKPFGLFLDGKKDSLILKESIKFNHKSWKSSYNIKRPGVYTFYVEPKPYFEPDEGKYISHVPKVIISSFGMENGWDKPIGLKYEIVPMAKPFAIYSGNIFTGKVLHNREAASNVEVEVELYNEYGLKAPSDTHITQVVKTDENGNFSFVMNHKGWWGFAALIEEGEKEYKGKMYPIENGALLWIKAY